MADKSQPDVAKVFWEGDSREVLRSFPRQVMRDLGEDLYRVQIGELPLDSCPMRSIGHGVFELRQRDSNGWYRLIYLKKIAGRVYVLHSFVKRSAKTSPKDLNVATQRLKNVQARLAEEKKDAKDRKK